MFETTTHLQKVTFLLSHYRDLFCVFSKEDFCVFITTFSQSHGTIGKKEVKKKISKNVYEGQHLLPFVSAVAIEKARNALKMH